MHERLRAHAESVAFFGGGYREKAVSLLKSLSLYESYIYLFVSFLYFCFILIM